MGWFWSDSSGGLQQARLNIGGGSGPPPGCPVHARSTQAPPGGRDNSPSCPVGASPSQQPQQQPAGTLSKLNPLNWMYSDLSQASAPGQTVRLPTARDPSSIPRDDAPGENWQYPSPQQMYNALLRKGYTDTDATAVESMVAWHNLLNEGAWVEIAEWERRFAGGLRRGWEVSRRGEENSDMEVRRLEARERANRTSLLRKARKGWVDDDDQGGGADGKAGEAPLVVAPPKLIRLQGRPGDMTPKAAMMQALGKVWPSYFGPEPPFDRHDWYVSRHVNGRTSEIRYVIDYYSGPPEPNGDPVFYLDVRPAATPTGAAERLIRWGGDVWWRASGGVVRERNEGRDPANQPKAKWYEWRRDEKEVDLPTLADAIGSHKK